MVVLIGVWVCQRRVWIGLSCHAWHSGVMRKKKRKNNLDPLVHALFGFSGRIFFLKGKKHDGGVRKKNRVLPHHNIMVTED